MILQNIAFLNIFKFLYKNVNRFYHIYIYIHTHTHTYIYIHMLSCMIVHRWQVACEAAVQALLNKTDQTCIHTHWQQNKHAMTTKSHLTWFSGNSVWLSVWLLYCRELRCQDLSRDTFWNPFSNYTCVVIKTLNMIHTAIL